MKYEKTDVSGKNCILSARFVPTQEFIEKLETDIRFSGGPVHADAVVNRKCKVTVYKPDEFVAEVPALVRVTVKTVNGTKYYKLVFIPNSDKLDEGIELPPEILVGQLAKLAGACSRVIEEWKSTVKPVGG